MINKRFCRLFQILFMAFGILMALAPDALAQFRRKQPDLSQMSETQLRKKYDRLRTSVDRVEVLIKRGYMPKAIEEARHSVAIAEEEFGELSMVAIGPIFTLAELLGKKRRYEEAEELFEQIFAIIAAEGEPAKIYAIGHRLTIGRHYIDWNQINKADETLRVARNLAVEGGYYYRRYLNLIDEELKKIEEIKEANPFLFKGGGEDE